MNTWLEGLRQDGCWPSSSIGMKTINQKTFPLISVLALRSWQACVSPNRASIADPGVGGLGLSLFLQLQLLSSSWQASQGFMVGEQPTSREAFLQAWSSEQHNRDWVARSPGCSLGSGCPHFPAGAHHTAGPCSSCLISVSASCGAAFKINT